MLKRFSLPHMGGLTITNTVMTKLLAELRQGEYSKCDRLPSEMELASTFNVSRSVIRDVLSKLEREGFIERCRGIGTIIHRDIVNLTNRLDMKYEYLELVRGAGCQPSCDNVRTYDIQADEELASTLNIQPHSTVFVCEKRILADDKPVIFSIDFIDKTLFDSNDIQSIDWSQPIFDILEKHCGITVDGDVANISASNATTHIRNMLGVHENDALLLINDLGYYKFSIPILYSTGYYSNFFDFTMLRKKM